MTHPITPREKVARIVDPGVWACLDETARVCPQFLSNYTAENNKGISRSLAKADAILTDLASGSGDHAELEYYGYRAFNAGIGCCRLVANPGPNDTNNVWACSPAARTTADAAKIRARQLAANGARCTITDTDRYRRNVARCTVNGRDLGAILVREGLAISETNYGDPYAREERQAREQGRGIWQ